MQLHLLTIVVLFKETIFYFNLGSAYVLDIYVLIWQCYSVAVKKRSAESCDTFAKKCFFPTIS